MASKRTVAGKGPDKRREAETVFKLSQRAKAEVAKLLKRNQDGTITRAQLETGLYEVEEQLKRMLGMIRHLL
jgi:hypothetical protein